MKDSISQDLAVSAAKIAPPAAVAVATAAGGLSLQDWVLITTIIYGVVQTSLTIVRGWGDWLAWWTGRMSDLRRARAWANGWWEKWRGRG